MRIALIAPMNFNQWLSLTIGLERGFRALGHEVRLFPLAVAYFPLMEIESFAAFAPELVLFFHFARPAGHRSCVTTDEFVRVAPKSCRFALLAFDNPLDLQSCIDLVARSPFVSHVFTPEPGALPRFADRGIKASVLRAWADPVLFSPTDDNGTIPTKEYDVLWVGDLRNEERGKWFNAFREGCAKHGLKLFEATMRGPLWGRQLGNAIRHSRLGIEAKRCEVSTQGMGVQYTWTSPRSYMFAACGVPWVCVGEWGEMSRDFPAVPYVDDPAQMEPEGLLGLVQFKLANLPALEAEGIVRLDQNRRHHPPALRALEIVGTLKL